MRVTRRTLATVLLLVFMGEERTSRTDGHRSDRIVGLDGTTLATNEELVAGKAVFQQNGL